VRVLLGFNGLFLLVLEQVVQVGADAAWDEPVHAV
jgi:hypothetical protein